VKRTIAFAIVASAILMSRHDASAQQEVRLATWGPPTTYFLTEVVLPWADAVSRDSNGTIIIKNYPGGVIANAGNTIDRVMDGVADIGWGLQGLDPQKFIKTSVLELPLFSQETSEEGAVALWNIYEKGVVASDYKGIEVFGMSSFAGSAIVSRGGPIRRLEDIKGLKLGVSGRIRGDTLTALGAVPMAFPVDQIYVAISRGTIDGTYGSLTAVRQFKTYEVATHFLDESFSGAAAMLIMSKQRFDALPEAARASFRKHSGVALSRALGVSNDGEMARVRTMIGELAQQGKASPLNRLSTEENERWRKAIEPVVAAWTKSVPDGQQVLDAFRAEINAARAGKDNTR
jgi:TRAP-type C4-dicarboxylate transport system substrate-binding protein